MQVEDNEKSVSKIKTHEPGESSFPEQQVIPMSQFFNDMNWLVPVSVVPTKRPLQPMGMLVLYVNGATKRLYVYNVVANTWSYTALT